MPPCKNQKNKKYSGNENTPLGRGYHAEGEKLDKKMKGKNGHMYKVVKIKNGKKQWKKNNKHKRTKRGEALPSKEDILNKIKNVVPEDKIRENPTSIIIYKNHGELIIMTVITPVLDDVPPEIYVDEYINSLENTLSMSVYGEDKQFEIGQFNSWLSNYLQNYT